MTEECIIEDDCEKVPTCGCSSCQMFSKSKWLLSQCEALGLHEDFWLALLCGKEKGNE